MANNKNLEKRVPFVKGDPRCNRNGRPRENELKELLMAYFDDNKVKAILTALDKKAKSGDVRAITEVLDRTIGKAINLNADVDKEGNDKEVHTIIIKKKG